MAKHKSVTIRVAKLNAAKKHKTTLIIDGKAAKVAYITQADVRSGGVKRLIATWTKIADQVALVYKGERATYCRKGSVIERTSLVKIVRASTTTKPKTAKAKPASAKKVASKKATSKKKSSGKKPSAYNLFVKAYLKAHPNLGKSGIKKAAAAWRAEHGGKKSVLKKSSAKKPSTKKVSTKARKTKTSSAKRGKSKYNLFVKAFLKANPGLGKAGIKKAAAAWRAEHGSKASTAKKPSKKSVVAKKPSKKTSSARKASPYNNFVKAYLKAHPGLGKGGMKAAAAAWRAKNGGKVSTKKPTKKTTKKSVVAKTPKKKAAPKASKKHAASQGVLPNPADILGKAAMKKAGKHC